MVYRNIWLDRKHALKFRYSANMLNINPRGFDRAQYFLIHGGI